MATTYTLLNAPGDHPDASRPLRTAKSARGREHSFLMGRLLRLTEKWFAPSATTGGRSMPGFWSSEDRKNWASNAPAPPLRRSKKTRLRLDTFWGVRQKAALSNSITPRSQGWVIFSGLMASKSVVRCRRKHTKGEVLLFESSISSTDI